MKRSDPKILLYNVSGYAVTKLRKKKNKSSSESVCILCISSFSDHYKLHQQAKNLLFYLCARSSVIDN